MTAVLIFQGVRKWSEQEVVEVVPLSKAELGRARARDETLTRTEAESATAMQSSKRRKVVDE